MCRRQTQAENKSCRNSKVMYCNNVSVHMTVFPPSSSQQADTASRYVYTEPYVKIRTCNKVNMDDIFYSHQAR